ncbi:EAL domain-containing protein [Turicibacter sanguinis]|uniref:EAL domain-containing protein n=1 Tax=Turicibacter sanguinis TaxID=154288 RepID=UPI0012BBA39F|nr:EAL domain-containing protein [Turicibacter sanguinis]MCU7196517.1 EAL domain-containing protein [Turicibacter sanguinis]MTP71634.1 EAL domain-containing protein [Turicibacter sanguinis]
MIKRALSIYFTTITKSKFRMLNSNFIKVHKRKKRVSKQSFFSSSFKFLCFIFLLSFFIPLPVVEANALTPISKYSCLSSILDYSQFLESNFSILTKSPQEYRNRQPCFVINKLSYGTFSQKDEVLGLNRLVMNKGILSYSHVHDNWDLWKTDSNLVIISILVLSILKSYNPFNKVVRIIKQKLLLKQLKNNQFIVYYQPIINPYNKKVVACEALLRFNDGERILTPYYFLNRIEEIGMMEEVTLWLLRKVMDDYQFIKNNQLKLDNEFYVSLNISFKQLENSFFIEKLTNIISTIDLEKIKLCFEICERYPLQDEQSVRDVIKELRELGVKIAIDDFGVEYSNLDILDKIEYDIIKLDQYFSDGIQESLIRRQSMLFVESFIRHHHKKLIIEGIENQNQLEIIKELGCEDIYIQGYLYSPPIGLDNLLNLKID